MFAEFKKMIVSYWATGNEFLKNTLCQPRLFWTHQKSLLRENLEREEELLRAKDFADVLRDWGITTEEALKLAIKERRKDRVIGSCLFIGGICLAIFNYSSTHLTLYWRTLQGIFYLSLTFLGAFMFLACTWRLQVFTHRKFVPFLVWLIRRGRI